MFARYAERKALEEPCGNGCGMIRREGGNRLINRYLHTGEIMRRKASEDEVEVR
jgi:hypothetical protein